MEKQLLKLDEVAKMFQVSERTVSNWIKERGFPVIKIAANVLRFDPVAVDEWIKGQSKRRE